MNTSIHLSRSAEQRSPNLRRRPKLALVRSVFAAFALFASSALFAQSEDVAVWEQIYRSSQTDDQRVDTMTKIVDMHDRAFAPFMIQALDELTRSQLTVGTTQQIAAKNKLALMIVRELGNLESSDAFEAVWQAYLDAQDPVLKAASAVTLGRIQASEYAPRLALDLAAINLAPVASNSRAQETLALGLVTSLQAMKDPAGFEPVFLASLGWYSTVSKVKETAKEAIKTMVDDPTDSLTNILGSNPDITVKQAAVEAAFASKAPAERKLALLRKALRIGLDRVSPDVADQRATARFRTTVIQNLSSLADKAPETVLMLIEMVKMDKRSDASNDETLAAIVALGINGSDDAARFLSERLMSYNNLERSDGNTVRDKSLIRQYVVSMKASKNPLVRPALLDASRSDYDSNIARLVTDALTVFN